MNETRTFAGEARMPDSRSPKLRAALDYLGDRLCTHPVSRFTPLQRPLLEEWLATRRAAQGAGHCAAASTVEVGRVAVSAMAIAEAAARPLPEVDGARGRLSRLAHDGQAAAKKYQSDRDATNGISKVVAMRSQVSRSPYI